MAFTPSSLRIGILGAGQLGKMLAQEASKLDIELHFLDKSKDYPAGKISRFFTEGDFRSYHDVVQFGKNLDVIGIEIEEVNIDALFELKKMGKRIVPDPQILQLIKDKGLQKEFYQQMRIPSASFSLFNNLQDVVNAIEMKELTFPFVQKLRIGGYDGRGVTIVKSKDDLNKLLEGPCVVEKMADIDKELSVICINTSSCQRLAYDVVEMEFNSESNLVEYLLSPAQIDTKIKEKAQDIALQICKLLEIQGLLAVEMFLNKDGSIWVNEIAPRPHNSGHHTLDDGSCSQFANQIRAMANLPAGQVESDRFAIMINLIGQEGYSGPVKYIGLDDCSKLAGVYFHLYGKSETRPHRKMGHVCVTDLNLDKCKEKANFVRQTIQVIS